ncbi:protein LSM12-like [Watersipora subatra]|uniref:protein LSM12-like n=1 Tax=Watersipora subatra TaxID=2589382 RepID=UPI00355B714B
MTRVEAPAGEPGDLGLELEAGTIVKCVTCHDTEIRGEVLALDLNKKAILIVSPLEPGSRHKHNTIHMLNTNNLKHVFVEKEPASQKERPLISLDNNKLTKRVSEQVDRKLERISHIGVGVSKEGQSLFNFIQKTIVDLTWSGKTIVAFKDVEIKEPYNDKDLSKVISGRNASSVDHISKLVRKHFEDKHKSTA